MPSTNFNLAPPAKIVDGLNAVPIDIQHLSAVVTLDAGTKTAGADATIEFVLGAAAGCPVFDLRQTIAQAWLDGVPISPSQLASHDFGGGADAGLRIVASSLPAASTHTLRLLYIIGQPQSPSSQAIAWEMGSARVFWDFWFTDLFAGRYLEQWFPANLIFDQFSFHQDLQILNSPIAHSVITNGTVISVEANHWTIDFPDRFTSLSQLLVLAATDRLNQQTGSVVMPGGATVQLELSQLTSTTANLALVQSNLQSYLPADETNVGPYAHGNRFTCYVWNSSRSMEYDGGVTTSVGALEHETFHSWYARGVKPATQNDGWIDEAFTEYNTNSNRFALIPFNMTNPPVTLCGSNPFARITPQSSYTSGFNVFAGLAALLGLTALRNLMADFYQLGTTRLITTGELEAYLISRTGRVEIADYFERFVYGLSALLAGPGPDLYLREAIGDPGVDQYTGPVFWDSPDLWVRHNNDGMSTHQDPEYGQDNWFYARVRNRGARSARTFVVTFNVKSFAGSQFVFPGDWFPAIAAVVGRDLAPGASMVVQAPWPRELVPAAGTHGCLLASVYTPTDAAVAGRHVWEHNNLAQKNLTIVDLEPNDTATIWFEAGNLALAEASQARLEIVRPERWPQLAVALTHPSPGELKRLFEPMAVEEKTATFPEMVFREPARLEIGWRDAKTTTVGLRAAPGSMVGFAPATPVTPISVSLPEIRQGMIAFEPGKVAGIPIVLRPRSPVRLGIQVQAPLNALPKESLKLHVLERAARGQVVGGITIQINIGDIPTT
jgi:hypothetical protein